MTQILRVDRPGASAGPAADLDTAPEKGGSVVLLSAHAEATLPPVSGERCDPPAVTLLADELVLLIDGERIVLTRTQFSIFSYFHENIGHWVTPHDLIRRVLGTHHQPDTSLVRVHVHAIRRRLGRAAVWLESDPRRVRGYRWGAPREIQVPQTEAS